MLPRSAVPPSEARIEMATLKLAGEHTAQLAAGSEIFPDRNTLATARIKSLAGMRSGHCFVESKRPMLGFLFRLRI